MNRRMKMKKLVLATSLASLGWISAANASLVSVTFDSYGAGVLPPSVPAGDTLVSNFSDGAGLTFSGTGTGLVTGDLSGDYLAPAYSSSSADTGQYLAVLANGSATLTLPKETGVQIYLGSFDSYNMITFSNGLSYTGTQLATMVSGLNDNGCQFCADTNGRLSFLFTPAEAVTWVNFTSDGQNAFEIAQVSSSGAIPETST